MSKKRDLAPEELGVVPVAEKRAREILRDRECDDMPLWSLLARAYIQGIRDTVDSQREADE